MSLILIRYGELALKSHRVRRRFEENLLDGISRQFEEHGLEWLIEREQGRIFLYTTKNDIDEAVFLLQHIPGIVSISQVKEFEITDGLGTIKKEAAEFSRSHLSSGMTFAVRARRAGSHSFTSQEAAGYAGEHILETIPGLKVKLKNPDVTIYLEVRGRHGYLFTESHRGVGGLPPGSQGRAILLISGKYSMTAGFLMMKRGCKLLPVHFLADRANIDPDTETAFNNLKSWDHGMELTIVREEMTEETVLEAMKERNAIGIVSGVRYENYDSSLHIPGENIFIPLIGMDEIEIDANMKIVNEPYNRFGEKKNNER